MFFSLLLDIIIRSLIFFSFHFFRPLIFISQPQVWMKGRHMYNLYAKMHKVWLLIFVDLAFTQDTVETRQVLWVTCCKEFIISRFSCSFTPALLCSVLLIDFSLGWTHLLLVFAWEAPGILVPVPKCPLFCSLPCCFSTLN